MRGAAEVFARRWWAGEFGAPGRVLSALTLPLSWIWAGASAAGLRRASAHAQRIEGLAVVSVGNLAVGGTGKTPLVGWIAAVLRDEGAGPAVLMGASGRDEALLHERRLPGVRVIVDRDRAAAAREALAGGSRVALLDDGFQHRRLHRDLDVVLLSAEDSFPGPLLPRGPYRERPGALSRADVILVTRRSASLEESQDLAARIAEAGAPTVVGGVDLGAARWTDLDGGPVDPPEGDVMAVCAIARPDAFRSSVGRLATGSVALVAFADHHEYTPADIERLEVRAAGRPIAITEKDAVKLMGRVGRSGDFYVLAEEVRWDWGEQAFLSRIRAATAMEFSP